MTTPLTHLPGTTDVSQIAAAMKRDGAVIVEDMISDEAMNRFLSDIGPLIECAPFGSPDFTGARTRRCGGLLAKSPHTVELLTHPLFIGTAEQLLSREQPYVWWNDTVPLTLYAKIQLSVTQAIQIMPGEKAQPLHRDDGVHHRRHPGPETQVQIMYAGTDFTEDNGATRVIPGSNQWAAERRPHPEEAIPATMRRGSGLFFFGSVYHGGGANVSRHHPRIGITLSLIPGHLRQEENQYLAVPMDIVKTYPPAVQALMGYVVSPPACGFVDLVDPTFLLAPPAPT
jgi:ectoine hydroxylase-related dioxygenase (phytanoyl-CoA dioxygenase family)